MNEAAVVLLTAHDMTFLRHCTILSTCLYPIGAKNDGLRLQDPGVKGRDEAGTV